MQEKRRHDRHRCHVPCEILQGKGRTPAVVRDLSLAGLSVQTDLWAEQGDHLRICLRPRGGAPVDLQVLVWNARRLRAKNGIRGWRLGMMLADPSDAFAELVAKVAGTRLPNRTSPPSPGTPPASKREPEAERPVPRKAPPLARRAGLGTTRWFRARVKQVQGRRTRMISVVAESEEGARQLAAEEIGPDWEVLELKSA